jgi:peptide/nickel transport system permease protein
MRQSSIFKHIIHNLKKNKLSWMAIVFLISFLLIALFSNFLANDLPFYIRVNQHNYFPLLSWKNQVEFFDENGKSTMTDKKQIDWKHLNFETAIFPPIAYSANTSDILNADYKSPNDEQLFLNADGKTEQIPFRFRHFLGTNKRGEDVLSGLIHGTGVSMLVGLLSMILASVVGIFFGLISGYFADDKLKLKRGEVLCMAVGLIFAWFYAFGISDVFFINQNHEEIFSFEIRLIFSVLIFIIVMFVFYFIGKKISNIHLLNKEIKFPTDTIISRVIEVLVSLPTLLLVITIAAISKPSIINLILIISMVQWTQIARLVRAEMLKLRNMEFMQAAEILGLSRSQILWKHALPNVLAPAMVSMAFGISAAILMESGLSFLGVGLPVAQVTWGTLINAGRENFQAWWLVIFPGCCIFFTVLMFNILGEAIRDAMDIRLLEE